MYQSPYSVLALCILILCLYRDIRRYRLQLLNNVLSWIINVHLNNRYPVLSQGDNDTITIPTCPYRWPNGQGDVAKFLEGEENSLRWLKEHGSIYRVWAGMTPEMYIIYFGTVLIRGSVLTQPEDVKTIIFKDSDLHVKASNNDAGWLIGQLLGKCIGLVSGSEWRKSRASVGDHFTFKSTSHFIQRIVEITKAYFSDLFDGRSNHGLITPSEDLRLLPFWVVAEYIYGPLTPHARDQLESLIPLRDSLFRTVIQGGVTRFEVSSYLPSSTNRDLQDFKQKWRVLNDEMYDASKRSHNSTVLTHMYESIHESGPSLDNVLQTMDEMLFGNLDVTIGALSWNPILLASNPAFTAELHEELTAVRNRDWAHYLARSDTLLACSILEAARLRPIAAFSIPQAAPETRVTGGYSVPGRTNFVVDTHALNIRNPYWGVDGREYRPSRFMNTNSVDMRYHDWRFGFRPRQCLGKYIADFIIRSIVVHLVLDLTLLPGSSWDKNPETWIAQSAAAIRYKRRNSVSHKSPDESRGLSGR
ncbi:cytochrome P450 [Xylaria venustula]|nr:cytochrome P450 [Xylaria venustula]